MQITTRYSNRFGTLLFLLGTELKQRELEGPHERGF